MSKIFRRILCALLGLIVGMVTTLGAVAATVYYTYGNLTIGDVSGNKYKDALGGLNNFSIEDLLGLAQKGGKAPENYTFADLEKDYGFDLIAFINQLGGGEDEVISTDESNKKYIDDLKKTSVFSLMSGNGFQAFMDNLSFGAVLSFIPADRVFSEQERIKLRRYTLGEMNKKDEDGQTGLVKALRNVRVGGVLPRVFDYDATTDSYSVKEGFYTGLNVIANVELDSFIDIVNKKSDWATEICEGGLASVGKLPVGEILTLCKVPEDITKRIDSAFGSLQIRDLFAQNEEGKYVFKLDNLYDTIKVGGVLGYEYSDTDAAWVDKDGNKVTGALQTIASLNVKDLIHALSDKDDALSIARKVALVFGDFSVGKFLETCGYTYNEESDKWLNKDGKEPKLAILPKIADLSVNDVFFGDGGMTWGRIRFKLATRVKALLIQNGAQDMTVGEAFGGIINIEVHKDGDKVTFTRNGNALNEAFEKLLETPVMEYVDEFGQETFEKTKFVSFVLTLCGDVKLGYFTGATDESGKWVDKDGNALSDKYTKIYDITVSQILTPVLNGETNPLKLIIDILGEDSTVGEYVAPILNLKRDENGVIDYTGSRLKRFKLVLNKFFDLTLDNFTSVEKAKTVIKDIVKNTTVGEVMGATKGEDGKWYDDNGNEVVGTNSTKKMLLNVYDKTIKEIYDSRDDLVSLFDDMKAGDVMEYKYCGGADDCEVNHTEHEKGWYNASGAKVGALEEKVANLTIRELTSGGLNFEKVLEGVKIGEAMNKVECDGTDEGCKVSEKYPAHVHDKGWYVKQSDGTYVKDDDVLMSKVSDEYISDLIAGKVKLSDTFNDVYLGEAMKKVHCDGVGDDCKVGHTDHEKGWYVKKSDGTYVKEDDILMERISDQTLGTVLNGGLKLNETFSGVLLGEVLKYKKTDGVWKDKNGNDVGAIERTVANIEMSEMLDGTLVLSDKFNDLYLGELMGYEKAEDGKWYKGENELTDEILLCVADFTFAEVKDGGFSEQLLNNVKNKVTVGRIFGESLWDTPAAGEKKAAITIIPKDTTMGNINEAIEKAVKESTAGDLYDSQILPFDADTIDQMDTVYGGICLAKATDTTYKYHDKAVAAIASVGIGSPTDEAYVKRVGNAFWRMLNANELLDVLLSAVNP